MERLLLLGWKHWTRLRTIATAAGLEGTRMSADPALPAPFADVSLPCIVVIDEQERFTSGRDRHVCVNLVTQRRLGIRLWLLLMYCQRAVQALQKIQPFSVSRHLAAVSNRTSLAHSRIGQTMMEAF